MKIHGIEGVSPEQLANEVKAGAKFVIFQWCISIGIMTFKRGTDVYYIRPGENAVVKGLPWTFLSLVVGWWGIPWGFIYTPMAVFTNLSGGKDVTHAVMNALMPALQATPHAADYVSDLPPQNPW